MKNTYLALACASVVLLGAGCLPTPKNIIENAVEKKMNAELGTDGSVDIKNGDISWTDGQGGTVNLGENVSLSADFPTDVVIMSDAHINGSATSPDGDWVMYTVKKEPKEVIVWYEASLTAAGWTKYGLTSTSGQETASYTKDGVWMSVVASSGDSDGMTSVMVTRSTQK